MKTVIIVLFSLMLISCGDKKLNYSEFTKNGIHYVKNQNTPALKIKNDDILRLTKNYSFSLESLDSLGQKDADFGYLVNFQLDDLGILYFYSFDSEAIYKVSDKGTRIKKLVTKGQGPSQLPAIGTFCVADDTLIVFSQKLCKKLSLKGDYLSQYSLTESILNATQLYKCQDKILVNAVTYNKTDNDLLLASTLYFYNNDLSFKNSYTSNEYSYTKDPHAGYFKENVYCFGGRYLYRTCRSKEKYKITKLDYTGKILEVVSKNYIKEKFSKEDYNELKKLMPDGKIDKQFYDYKIAVHKIHLDKNGNLWAQETFSNFSDKFIRLSIFKNGIYQATYQSLFNEPEDGQVEIYFIKNKLLVLNASDLKVTVYDYEVGI